MGKKICKNWYFILIALFFISAAAVYLYFGEDSYIAVHDNLDLFVAQFQMMKNTGSFFSHNVDVPFLGGISRDHLPSELSLYTLLYVFLPSFGAYITGYFLKIIIAMVSVWLLAKDWYKEEYEQYKPMIMLMGFAYGLLHLFPAFGIPFAAIPLAVFLLRKIYYKPSVWLYIALFCYPFLSYFSYFGFFILAYLVVALLWLGIRDKRISKGLLGALVVLAMGYVVFEYRLFGVMLFGNEETIRSTMVEADLSGAEIFRQIVDVWKNGMFHADGVHTKLILPVCVIYFFGLNIQYLRKKDYKGIGHDIYNLLMLILVFNCVIYGIYYWGGFRRLVETLVPPLRGFQFNRTIFFNPFLWYASFFLILQRLYRHGGRYKRQLSRLAEGLALLSIAIVLLNPGKYNDLYTTCKDKAYEIIKGKVSDDMSYREFYSDELFSLIKEDIDYSGEWSAAYGIHPAVLEYNGIATLDGYLGFYSQQYKEDFRRIIAPALERVEESRIYFDDWGARAYLYSGTDLSAVSATRLLYVTDYDIYIDTEAFEELGGRYIFSRLKLGNAEEAGLTLAGSYESDKSPYRIYLYKR